MYENAFPTYYVCPLIYAHCTYKRTGDTHFTPRILPHRLFISFIHDTRGNIYSPRFACIAYKRANIISSFLWRFICRRIYYLHVRMNIHIRSFYSSVHIYLRRISCIYTIINDDCYREKWSMKYLKCVKESFKDYNIRDDLL